MEALRFPQAAAVCGPVVEGTVVPNGAKVSRERRNWKVKEIHNRMQNDIDWD